MLSAAPPSLPPTVRRHRAGRSRQDDVPPMPVRVEHRNRTRGRRQSRRTPASAVHGRLTPQQERTGAETAQRLRAGRVEIASVAAYLLINRYGGYHTGEGSGPSPGHRGADPFHAVEARRPCPSRVGQPDSRERQAPRSRSRSRPVLRRRQPPRGRLGRVQAPASGSPWIWWGSARRRRPADADCRRRGARLDGSATPRPAECSPTPTGQSLPAGRRRRRRLQHLRVHGDQIVELHLYEDSFQVADAYAE